MGITPEVLQKLYRACKIARSRFSSQNNEVSLEVYMANYEAVCALTEAIKAYENEAID
jgi:hypothetical protein